MDWITERLGQVFSHSRWIILNGVSANTQLLIDQLREWGGSEFLVVAGEEGVGTQPDVEKVFMPSPPGTVMEGFRRFAAKVSEPPPNVRRAVDRFDPDGTARVLGPVFAAPDYFLGRRLYGTRPLAWEGLEDKTAADAIWDQAEVARAPSEVIRLDDATEATARLAGSSGAVWAADNTDGWHGGGEMTRWVSGPEMAATVISDWRDRVRRVRVMPFLDGVPCSIHGVVTSDGVAALRPVELLILRRTDRTGFVYAGVANTWDPPASIREDMRDAARRVGEILRRQTGHRGPFSIDGVVTADGFRPTELNPRFSVGYGIQAGAVPELKGGFFVRALVEGDIDVPAMELEDRIVTAADAQRAVRLGVPVEGVHEPQSTHLLVDDAGNLSEDPDGDLLEIGPSPSGSFLFWAVDPTEIEPGSRFAPLATEVIRFARQRWGIPIPECEPAPDVTV
ncbi:MAG: hypothetical protein ACLGHX_10115 [Acidimicrobiia bacterium]